MWNAGMPFHHTYLPFLPMTVALFAKASGCSPALSYHAVTAFFYCLGAVTLYLMAWGLSGRIHYSFLSALAYSLVSPAAILFPAIRGDVGGMWNARRLHVLLYYGGGPQVTSLALLPLAVLLLYLSLRRRRRWLYVLTGMAMASVVLTNAFGAVALAFGVVCVAITQRVTSFRSGLLLILGIATLTYLWISPWLPPSFLDVAQFNAQTAGGDYRWTARSLLAIAAVVGMFLALWTVIRRRRLPDHLGFFLLFAAVLTCVTALGLQYDLNAIPQGHRYHLEMEMALCLLAAFAAKSVLDRLPKSARKGAVAVCLLLAAWQMIHYRQFAREVISPVDIRQTPEYRTAMLMREHFGDQRVMVAGSPSFWFNVFTDTPQLSGGHDPFNPNWMTRVAIFTLYSGMNAGERDAEVCILWLKAFGARGINVPGPESQEPYKPFQRNPTMFEGLLPVVDRRDGDTIYRVPHRSPGLAHVVPASAIVDRVPTDGLDVEPVKRYVAALEDESLPRALFEQTDFHSAVVRTDVQPDQVVSVQITYHAGWHATVDGVRQPTFADGLGMLVIRPDCRGPCEIELSFDGGLEAKVTRYLSILTMLGVIGGVLATSIVRWPMPR
jgi:hypothetical protein